MIFSQTLKRNFARAILICFAPIAVAVPTSQAAIIDTDQIISGNHAQSDRVRLIGTIKRNNLREQMLNAGINPDQLQDRIAHLSDKEVAVLNEQLDNLPAGGSLIGYSVFIFLVLLMTDIMGYTEIFPFVKKTVK